MNLSKRLLEHINNKHSNVIALFHSIQNAIRKYGLDNFSVLILELLCIDNNLLACGGKWIKCFTNRNGTKIFSAMQ